MVDAPDLELPDWIKDLRGLRPYVDELRDFADDPTEYVIEIVLVRFVNWILTGVEMLIGTIQTALNPLISVPNEIAEPILEGGGLITAALSGIIGTLNETIVTISMAAGPLSPLVVFAIWGLIFIAVAELIRQSIPAIIEISLLVIPWA